MIFGLSAPSSSSELDVPPVSVLVIIDTVTSKSFCDILELLFAGVEDGLGGCGHLVELVKGGEWNNRFEGDKLGEDDLLKGVLLCFWS